MLRHKSPCTFKNESNSSYEILIPRTFGSRSKPSREEDLHRAMVRESPNEAPTVRLI